MARGEKIYNPYVDGNFLVSDTGESRTGAFIVHKGVIEMRMLSRNLDEGEKKTSSTMREMIGVDEAI